jgi:hypothetical protein
VLRDAAQDLLRRKGRHMKLIANVLLFFDALIFIPWPLLSLFVLGFAFDAPNSFNVINCSGVLIFLTYPLGFIAAWRARRKALKEGTDWCTNRIIRLLALPYVHLALVFGLAYLSGHKNS